MGSSPCSAFRELVRWWPYRWDIVSQTSSPSVVLGSSSTASPLPSPSWKGRCFVVCLSDACGRHGQHVAFSDWDAPSRQGLHDEVFCRHCRHFFSGTPSWVQVGRTLDLVSTTHEQFARK